jgi:hypothetical protein
VPGAVRLERWSGDSPSVRYARGHRAPRAIAWFGFSAFWGHLRHLVASAIATDNVDSRKWMIPERGRDLLRRALAVVEAPNPDAPTLADALGGEVFVDFVADTGDDAEVSEAVARLVASAFEVPDRGDPERTRVLPRGDVLLLGGDVAYPVATAREITRRLAEPWNHVLAAVDDGKRRLLLAIPGNHDWYDGLDGFARLCQAPMEFEDVAEIAGFSEERRSLSLDHPVLAWVQAFAKGRSVRKPDAIVLHGYVPVQRTSYFRLPLAEGVDLLGLDRQLKSMDDRQRAFFLAGKPRAKLVVMPDPVRAFGEIRPTGKAMVDAIGVDPATQSTMILAGDIHHYERSTEGPSLHVVAGGGGAFLHGARIPGGGAYRTDAEFPGPKATWALMKELPLYTALGRAGWIVTILAAVGQGLGIGAHFLYGLAGSLPLAILGSVLVAVATALLVGWRRRKAYKVVPFALALGAFVGALPQELALGLDRIGVEVYGEDGGLRYPVLLVAWALATFLSGYAFGAVLALLARLGLNHEQPSAALGAPCFRHFVRLHVHRVEGRTVVDGYCIGQVDPVGKSPPVLVDVFRWDPAARC